MHQDGDPERSHAVEAGGSRNSQKPGFSSEKAIQPVEDHVHPVVGGDPETRPVNRAVHWIIYAGEGR